MADNDLAFGQIVEAVSHSRFWKETCIFAIEDDPQAGWDHVSGYRTTAYVVSPYTKREAGREHTIQPDQSPAHHGTDPRPAADEPNGRHRHADVRLLHRTLRISTPFTAVTNNIPLDQMNPEPKKISDSRFAQGCLRLRTAAARQTGSMPRGRTQSHLVAGAERIAEAVSLVGGARRGGG